MKEKIKLTMKTLGNAFSFAVVINFYIWLFFAIMQDGKVTIQFNFFGEALIEYIIYAIILPVIAYAFWWDLKKYKDAHRESQSINTDNQ